jgi:signal transduction histidine kinase
VLLYYLLWQVPVAVRGEPVLGWELVPLAFLPCPVMLAAAVLRFGLFDVKVVAGRSLLYGLLSVGVIGGYVGLVTLLGSLLSAGPVLVPPLLATVVLAVVFQPGKDRLQRAVSRLLFGSRDEPYRALSALGRQLETAAVGSAVLPTVADTVAGALRMPYAAVEVCASDGTTLRRAEVGCPPAHVVTLPAVAGGEVVGRLLVTPRPPVTEFTDSELRLLTDLARQAAPALQALRLTAELQQSRDGLLRAQAEERRRLQRDLHDGIGPSLAGLTLQIGAARALLAAGHDQRTAAALVDIERHLADCAADVRQLLTGLRSPLLDSLGLLGALRYQADRLGAAGGPVVTITAAPELPGLPAAVEEAALAIAAEAMTNATRHADARHCQVSITVDDALELHVVDDGRGFRNFTPTGIGLRSIRQRAADLGGSCHIGPNPGGGTQVRVRLPLTAS